MRSSMFSAQLTALRYRSTNLLAGLNLNISVNMRESLTDFWATMYIFKSQSFFHCLMRRKYYISKGVGILQRIWTCDELIKVILFSCYSHTENDWLNREQWLIVGLHYYSVNMYTVFLVFSQKVSSAGNMVNSWIWNIRKMRSFHYYTLWDSECVCYIFPLHNAFDTLHRRSCVTVVIQEL
jgi:hypothetical protein